jgi:hypothetical protein
MSAGVLISYFDPSSKAFDYQSKNPGARPVRVANLTRKASLTDGLEKPPREWLFRPHLQPLRRLPQNALAITTFYNAALMQVDM